MESNDIELFSTVDIAAKTKVVSLLVRNRISYLERWEKIPFFKRRDYRGAKELCVIYVNGNQYDKAKSILDDFNDEYFKIRNKMREEMEAERREAEEQGENVYESAGATARTVSERLAAYDKPKDASAGQSEPDIDEGIDTI